MRDDGKKRDRRGSIVDLFLVLLLLLSLASGLIRWNQSRIQTEEGVEIYRAVLLSGIVTPESADCLEVGEWIFDEAGERIGRVIAIDRIAAPLTVETGNAVVRGEWEMSKRCRLRVEVELNGRERDGVLLVDAVSPFGIGGERVLFSERMRLEARLLAFSKFSP